MNAPDRVTADLRQHDADQARLLDAASFKDEARDALIEKLKNGKQVGRCDLHDLIDCELNSDRYCITRDELAHLLTADSGERAALADQCIQGLIERYLDTHPDLIEEEATEIAHAE